MGEIPIVVCIHYGLIVYDNSVIPRCVSARSKNPAIVLAHSLVVEVFLGGDRPYADCLRALFAGSHIVRKEGGVFCKHSKKREGDKSSLAVVFMSLQKSSFAYEISLHFFHTSLQSRLLATATALVV